MPGKTGTCVHCGETVDQSGDYTWWSTQGEWIGGRSPRCADGQHEHFAPVGARSTPLTAAEAMAGVERVHTRMMELITPALEGRPEWAALFSGILDAVRVNDVEFPLEDNRPDWFGQSDKWRAIQRAPFHPQLWLLGDGIARSEIKTHVYEVLPTRVADVATCLAANLRGMIENYARGYFELAMQGIDHLMRWCDA